MSNANKLAAGLAGIVALAEHPEYKRAAATLGEPGVELNRCKARIREIENELSNLGTSKRAPTDDELLTGGEGARLGWRRKESLVAELRDLQERVPELEHQAHQNQGRLATLAGRLSREVRPRLLPAYRASRRRVLEALVELARANELHERTLDAFGRLGYAHGFNSESFGLAGIASDYNGPAAAAVRKAVEEGIIDRTDPLCKLVSALTGKEAFLPENAARIERERQEALKSREEWEKNPTDREPEPRRLWGLLGPAEPATQKSTAELRDEARKQPPKPDPRQVLGQKVRESIAAELPEVLELVAASVA